jgi:parallel beta-helix repeat protein
MRRIPHVLSVAGVVLVTALGLAGTADAQPSAPAPPQQVSTTECTPVNAAGFQLCSSDKGTLRLIVTPGAPPFSRLDLTSARELRQNGKVIYTPEEQHLERDLTKKPSGAQDFVRTGAVVIGGGQTCTYDESSSVVGTQVRLTLSNLACAPEASASTGTSGGASATANRAAKPAPPPPPAALPTYGDYSATDTAPNGLTTPIRYGTNGMGSPLATSQTDPSICPTVAGSDFQTKINTALANSANAVICVQPGDYSGSTMTINNTNPNRSITVRAVQVKPPDTPDKTAKVRNMAITGSNVTVDGFDVVGGTTLGSPSYYAIKFSGTGHKIINNLVRGRGIQYAIGCDQSAGCGTNVLISGNTITGVHNFGIYLWGGDHITVEKNNVFDLFQSTDVDDVDALRAWGTNHVIRNNYFHDINGKKSAGSPHSDCYQTYQAGSGPRLSSNILFENNYCVRVTGQCFIAQNDQRNSAELHDFILRGNVCETGGWQSIEFDGIPNITMDNDYVAGVQVTVLNFANPGAGGLLSSNYKVRDTVLVRGQAGDRYIDGTPADNTANRQFVDANILTTYNTFIGQTTASYPPVTTTDFNKFYRDSITVHASPAVTNAGQPPNSTGLTTDVDGAARVQGTAIDVGPFELG